jgi:hypothetical protein
MPFVKLNGIINKIFTNRKSIKNYINSIKKIKKKMNRQETINSIKSSLKKLFSTEYKFADYTTTDGNKIHCGGEKIDIGVDVQGVDSQGNYIPLNDGSYELTEGITINVVGGKVESITETGSEVPESPEDEMKDVGKEVTPNEEPKEEEMAAKVKTLEDQMSEVLGLIKEMAKGQSEMKDTLMSQIQEVKESPATNPIMNEKKAFSGFDKSFSKQMKMSEIEEIRKYISDKNKSNNNLVI